MTNENNGIVACREEELEDLYDIKEELGRGQFAVVKRCISKETGNEVAAKFIKLKRTQASRNGLSRELIEREASILFAINHEKVIKVYDMFDLSAEMVLVMELLSGGELFDKICECEYLTEVDACSYIKQVLEAVDYIHALNIVHLDIKPENIVLQSKDCSEIKLVDFGLAQRIVPGRDLREMMGTPEFVAPEIINYEAINCYTDMWAIGVLAFILLSGCSPFLGDTNQETYENIIKNDYHLEEDFFDNISNDAREFISSLLVIEPGKRITASECLAHPWLDNMSVPRARAESVFIATTRLKSYLAKRRWQQTFQKLSAVNRFSKFLKKITSIPEEKTTNNASEQLTKTNHAPTTDFNANILNISSDSEESDGDEMESKKMALKDLMDSNSKSSPRYVPSPRFRMAPTNALFLKGSDTGHVVDGEEKGTEAATAPNENEQLSSNCTTKTAENLLIISNDKQHLFLTGENESNNIGRNSEFISNVTESQRESIEPESIEIRREPTEKLQTPSTTEIWRESTERLRASSTTEESTESQRASSTTEFRRESTESQRASSITEICRESTERLRASSTTDESSSARDTNICSAQPRVKPSHNDVELIAKKKSIVPLITVNPSDINSSGEQQARKESLAHRKYSREVQVHYTQIMREDFGHIGHDSKTSLNLYLVGEAEEGYDTTKAASETSSNLHKISLDVNPSDSSMIRRNSSRKKAMVADHKNLINDDLKEPRSTFNIPSEAEKLEDGVSPQNSDDNEQQKKTRKRVIPAKTIGMEHLIDIILIDDPIEITKPIDTMVPNASWALPYKETSV